LIILLGALLLQDVALDPPRDRGDANDAAQVLREAELCFRCAKSPGLKREIAEGLEGSRVNGESSGNRYNHGTRETEKIGTVQRAILFRDPL